MLVPPTAAPPIVVQGPAPQIVMPERLTVTVESKTYFPGGTYTCSLQDTACENAPCDGVESSPTAPYRRTSPGGYCVSLGVTLAESSSGVCGKQGGVHDWAWAFRVSNAVPAAEANRTFERSRRSM